MAEHAASGAVNWDDHAVKLNQSTGEVVDQLGKKVSAERKIMGIIVLCLYDLYGRRGWMNPQRLESSIKGHFYVRQETIKRSQSKLTNTSESNHECPTNFQFCILDGDYVTMGYSRHKDKLDQRGEQITHLWVVFPENIPQKRRFMVVDLLCNIGGLKCVYNTGQPAAASFGEVASASSSQPAAQAVPVKANTIRDWMWPGPGKTAKPAPHDVLVSRLPGPHAASLQALASS